MSMWGSREVPDKSELDNYMRIYTACYLSSRLVKSLTRIDESLSKQMYKVVKR